MLMRFSASDIIIIFFVRKSCTVTAVPRRCNVVTGQVHDYNIYARFYEPRVRGYSRVVQGRVGGEKLVTECEN